MIDIHDGGSHWLPRFHTKTPSRILETQDHERPDAEYNQYPSLAACVGDGKQKRLGAREHWPWERAQARGRERKKKKTRPKPEKDDTGRPRPSQATNDIEFHGVP
jgi:hypothetical protein